MKTILAAALIAAFSLSGCASGGTASEPQAYREDGLPAWTGQSFSNPRGLWAGYAGQKGYYASGASDYADRGAATTAAELDAKSRLLRSVQRNKKNVTALTGVRRVDRFIADDGSVYVLMFISEKDAKKSGRK